MYSYRNIKNNQTIGYSQEKIVNGKNCLCEFAIKKQVDIFKTYFFCVETKHIDTIEEYAHDELLDFTSLEDAVNYLKSKGANEYLLKPMKGISIF
ncbi:hypothetical protein [Bacteroides fragilis]|uniref:hypothetical protein n=1 Tax=Bacteroides fragilis TaxID=817 RepID=UPI00202DCD47|nr:hypothetical protein [Bacteroides fragilis]MCM0261528.1 hypothetical protein [Bacteroides fragilis]